MATNFPNIAPTARQYTPPEWATTKLDSQAHTTTRRVWSDTPSFATLSLTFANISDAEAELIVRCHYDAMGACDIIDFDGKIVDGICDDDLKGEIQLEGAASDQRWHFVERGAVSVQSVSLGLSTVTCKFRSEVPG